MVIAATSNKALGEAQSWRVTLDESLYGSEWKIEKRRHASILRSGK